MKRPQLFTAVGLLALLLTAAVVINTTPIAQFVTRRAIALLNARQSGELTVREARGSILRHLDLRGVTLKDSTGQTLLSAERVEVRYNLFSLLFGRIRLGPLRLTRPAMHLMQGESGGPYGLLRVFETRSPGGPASPLDLTIRDVAIDDGSLIASVPRRVKSPDEKLARPVLDTVQITGLNALLAVVRVQSGPGKPRTTHLQIDSALARVADPALDLRGLAGRVTVHGDSIALDLTRLALPGTELTANGWMIPDGEEDPRFAGTVGAERLNTSDFAAFSQLVPRNWLVYGQVQSENDGSGVILVQLDDVRIDAAGGTTRAEGRVLVPPNRAWTPQHLLVQFENVSVRRLAEAYDVPDLSGRLSGTLSANGPPDHIALDVDLDLVQATIHPVAHSRLEGSGNVSVIPGAEAVHEFRITSALLDLRSARALAPKMPLVGDLELTGKLWGPARDLSFDGELRYGEPSTPRSVARGVLRLTRRNDLIFGADVTLDSLRFASFQRSFPTRVLRGVIGGRFDISGRPDSLVFAAIVGGAPGRLVASGLGEFEPGTLTIRSVSAGVFGLNLQAVSPELPRSSISGTMTGSLLFRDDLVQTATIRVSVDSSPVGRATIDTAILAAHVSGGTLYIDSFNVRATGLKANATGTLALHDTAASGILRFVLNADSLGRLRPLLAAWPTPIDTTQWPNAGAVIASGTVEGSLDRYQANFEVEAEDVSVRRVFARRATLTGFVSRPGGTLSVSGTADSMRVGSIAVAEVTGAMRGRLDSMAVNTQVLINDETSFATAARTTRKPDGWAIALDSLLVRRALTTWHLDSAATVFIGPERWAFDAVTLTRDGGGGRVAIDGTIALNDTSRVRAVIDSIALYELAIIVEEDLALSGMVDGEVELRGTTRNPTGKVHLTVTDAKLGPASIPSLLADATFAGSVIRGEVTLHEPGKRPLHIAGEIPVPAAGRGSMPLRIDVSADGMPLQILDLAIPSIDQMGGTIDARVAIRGSLTDPTFEGHLELKEAAARLLEMGVKYDTIGGRVTFSRDRMVFERIRLIAQGDSAHLGGAIVFEDLDRPVVDLLFNAWTFPVMDNPDLLSGSASGRIITTGPVFAATVRGEAKMAHGIAYPDQFIQKQVIDLSDSLYAQFVDTTVLHEGKLGAGFLERFLDSLKVDRVEADLGPNFWIRTPDANVQLGGVLLVSKRGEKYLVDGTVNALRGAYALRLGAGITREFEIESGTIRYFGTEDLNAELDIVAHHDRQTAPGEDVRITVHIRGTIKRPQIQMTSSIRPVLTEPEIISYLVFGAPSVQAFVGDRTGQRRSVFTQSAERFVGALSGQVEDALIHKLGLPVDMLRIEPGQVQNGLSGTELLIGKQVTIFGKSSFLTASPRLCPRDRLVSLERIGVSLETRLTRHWGVAGSVDPVRGCETSLATSSPFQLGLDLFWEKR